MDAELALDLFRIVAGTAVVALFGVLAVRRVRYLVALVGAARPNPERDMRANLRRLAGRTVANILGGRRLFRWTVPGIAHFWVMWAFFVLQTTLIEAAGELYVGPEFTLPLLGAISVGGVTAYDVLGFLQDTFALLSLAGILIFAAIRTAQAPQRLGRDSRFAGSNLTQGWWVLGAEVLVVWTLWVAHGVRAAKGYAPTEAAYVSQWFGRQLVGIEPLLLEWIGAVNLVVHLAIVGGFLLFTLHSKHLHILTIPFQELSRDPDREVALGKLHTELIDLEAMDEDTVLGVGKVEHLTYDRFLDLMTCTECGRCQSQCPAWTTGKPLSPKMLIMDLRDHMFAKGPYLTGQRGPEDGVDILGMMLVGDTPGQDGAVIDTDEPRSTTP